MSLRHSNFPDDPWFANIERNDLLAHAFSVEADFEYADDENDGDDTLFTTRSLHYRRNCNKDTITHG